MAALTTSALLSIACCGCRQTTDATAATTPGNAAAFQPRWFDLEVRFFSFSPDASSWPQDASLEEVGAVWARLEDEERARIDRVFAATRSAENEDMVTATLRKVTDCMDQGEPQEAYALLQQLRKRVAANKTLARRWLYSIVYFQGVAALRLGEDENCILCRGESSCIVPIAPSAVHTNPAGSRLAASHFGEYLRQFPHDDKVRWLLNVAHMTLGEHPDEVEPQHRVSLGCLNEPGFDIGKFRDVGHLLGVNRFNQAGGAILDDFDNDGTLDVVVTSWVGTEPMGWFRNRGDGKFDECTAEGGLSDQLGGLNCVQADFDNDGFLDIFIPRAAWLPWPIRPSLLRNNGDGTFSDVTAQAGLATSLNSNCGVWADYDNDGDLDLLVCCERQGNRLYRNVGNGSFEDVAEHAGMQDWGEMCKGACWSDIDNDDYPDLYLSYLTRGSDLFLNQKDGTFAEEGALRGIEGPSIGFSCWTWDYNNDGWLDIFSTSYDLTEQRVVKGLLGRPQRGKSNRFYQNLGSGRFRDVASEAGLNCEYTPMGSNFGDFDNDGFLDLYLATGEPDIAALVPNRMFKNVEGKRFAEITGSSGTGHLQKGHGVACGDWNRDGCVDLFIETGGARPGDRYHNVLFQNPGQPYPSLTIKLIGNRTNRSAIGARIKIVTAGKTPQTIHRHISSGSSFGANPLEQTIGLGDTDRAALVEIRWPTSGTTQTLRDIPPNVTIQVVEEEPGYQQRPYEPIPLPEHTPPGSSSPEGAAERAARPSGKETTTTTG